MEVMNLWLMRENSGSQPNRLYLWRKGIFHRDGILTTT
jgi:hypothetical protein